MGQLFRSWRSTLPSNRIAIDEYRSRLRGIKAVWISHPHADHHLGLLRLLSERAAICGADDPIVLMAPSDMFAFLEEYRLVVPEINHSYLPVDCCDMIHGRAHPLGKRLYDELGITNCMSIPVAHCLRSYAVVIDGTSFGKVAYSGDCRPSNRFSEIASGTDLLIHEATFEDGMEEDAVLKRHSTVGEAIDVAMKMKAKSLVLTHFSQRYPKIPPMERTKDSETEIPIVFAFDFMKLTPGISIDLAAKLTPALRLLYPDEGVDEEETAIEKTVAKELMTIPGLFAVNGIL
jgi:ribonuclease Z